MSYINYNNLEELELSLDRAKKSLTEIRNPEPLDDADDDFANFVNVNAVNDDVGRLELLKTAIKQSQDNSILLDVDDLKKINYYIPKIS